ncbi:MAG: hypothetical protein ACPG4X_20825 [Pikeienuella sp.]
MARPTKYKPDMCQVVIDCGKQGMTLAEMAAELDIDRSTLNEWTERHAEFSRAVKSGLDRAQAWWEGKGREHTFEKADGFNATSFIFNMKNRFRDDWNDKTTTEIEGKLQTEEVGAGAAKLTAFLENVAERSRASGEPDE